MLRWLLSSSGGFLQWNEGEIRTHVGFDPRRAEGEAGGRRVDVADKYRDNLQDLNTNRPPSLFNAVPVGTL
ncbi:unnamed protein product [Boreogadus saida]